MMNPDMTLAIERKLQLHLASLGDSADDIAAFLEGQGVRGRPRTRSLCPIATHLRDVFGYTACVSCQTISLSSTTGLHALVGTPKAVSGFISAFDGGAYPALATP